MFEWISIKWISILLQKDFDGKQNLPNQRCIKCCKTVWMYIHCNVFCSYCYYSCAIGVLKWPYLIAWWRHQMEAFSALLAICAGNSPGTGEFPTQRPITRGFEVYFDRCPNKRLIKQSWGWWFETPPRPLRRHRNGDMKPDEHSYGPTGKAKDNETMRVR